MILAAYQLDENDYLNYYLFVASNSEQIKKRRKFSHLLWPVLYVALAAYFFFKQNGFVSIYLLVIAVVWYWLFPKWDKKRYVNHYLKFIENNYKGKLEKNVAELDADFIFFFDTSSEGKSVGTNFKESRKPKIICFCN